jgi:histidine ammonia-lyase
MLFVDVSVGPKLPPQLVRAAMLIRANMLLQGVSAVKQKDIEVFITLLNKNITPIVGSYGSLGASGASLYSISILITKQKLYG